MTRGAKNLLRTIPPMILEVRLSRKSWLAARLLMIQTCCDCVCRRTIRARGHGNDGVLAVLVVQIFDAKDLILLQPERRTGPLTSDSLEPIQIAGKRHTLRPRTVPEFVPGDF